MGNKTTWNPKGVRQVATVGMEEKRAFTLIPTISASGELLPMQTIYFSQTTVSCPSKKAEQYDEAAALRFKFKPSKSGTYWSMQATMRLLINNVIAPYFDKKKETLGLLL
jgi:hypothetical protein